MALTSGTPVAPASIHSCRTRGVQVKRIVACNYCRAKKIRCNGDAEGPCTNCLDRNQNCVSSTPRRWRTSRRSGAGDDLADRLARVEALLKQSAPPPASAGLEVLSEYPTPLPSDCFRTLGDDDPVPMSPPQLRNATDLANITTEGGQNQDEYLATFSDPQKIASVAAIPDPGFVMTPKNSTITSGTMPSSTEWSAGFTSTMPLDLPNPVRVEESSPEEKREQSCISSCETSGWEYHGPRSFLSICSRPGMQWVASRTGSSSFDESARKFTTYITSRLKIEKMLSKERKSEPSRETAWRYTRAFFDEALESALGIVHRPWFELQLRNHFNGTISDDDPAWYALRNTVYAFGCRIELSKCSSFRDTTQSAWGWFENALSAHTEVLYFRTSIVGVQAVTLMAYFTQNFGNPCLEYMLCSAAVRLSVAKGLHRQPVSSWNLTNHENSLRSCLFWAAYCLEKQIVCQSGRHSLIDDEDISCTIPMTTPPNSTVNVEYFNILIRIARLSSLVSKKLSSVRAFQQGAESIVRSVAELDEQLDALKASIAPIISLVAPFTSTRSPSIMTQQQITHLRFAFFSLGLDLHTSMTYPWSRSMLGLTPYSTLRDQAQKSTQIVVETCRNAILASDRIEFGANTPVSIGFFGPIHALINLFIHILQDPQRPGVQSDLVLMDMGAGYFARVQFATDSEVSISFAREMAALAHHATENASRRPTGNNRSGLVYNNQDSFRHHSQMSSESVADRALLREDQISSDQTIADIGTPWDLEWESWSTFLPTSIDDASM